MSQLLMSQERNMKQNNAIRMICEIYDELLHVLNCLKCLSIHSTKHTQSIVMLLDWWNLMDTLGI